MKREHSSISCEYTDEIYEEPVSKVSKVEVLVDEDAKNITRERAKGGSVQVDDDLPEYSEDSGVLMDNEDNLDCEDYGEEPEDTEQEVEEGDGIEEEDFDTEDIKFMHDDFDITITEQALEQFNEAYGKYMEMLGGKAEDSVIDCTALVLGRAQDVRPVPTTLEQFQERLPYLLITEDAKDLREMIEDDLENDPSDRLEIVRANLQVCADLEAIKKFGQLFQYLTVLTDMLFDADHFEEMKFPDCDQEFLDLANFWIRAFEHSSQLDEGLRKNLGKFLVLLPAKLENGVKDRWTTVAKSWEFISSEVLENQTG